MKTNVNHPSPPSVGSSPPEARPLVSVGLPVFNEARHLRASLDSLLAQTYPNLEIIASDNCSTDRTGDICREYAARDPRVRYFRQSENGGASRNFNRCLALASGEYFKWASGHDQHPSDLIERCVAVLRSDPALALCYPPTVWEGGEDACGSVDTRGERNPFARLGATLWGVRGGAVYGLFRTEMLKRTLGFERVVAPDVILLAELSVLGGFAPLDGPRVVLRQDSHYGDWSVYIGKVFGDGPRRPSCLYWKALARLCGRAGRHLSLRGKLQAYALAAPAWWARFAWVREGLWALGFNEEESEHPAAEKKLTA